MPSSLEVVEAYMDCWRKRDLSDAPFADRLRYENPLSGEPLEGKHNVIRFLQAYLPVLQGIAAVRYLSEGEYVATLWEAKTTFGDLKLMILFRVEEGFITEMQSFFDPRQMLERMGTHSLGA